MKRLFLAIPVPLSIQRSLIHFKDSMDTPDMRWVVPENYHITVSFFGEQDESVIPSLLETTKSVLSGYESFILEFNRILYAPPEKSPSMLWAQYQVSDTFTQLVLTLEDRLQSIFPFVDKREGKTPLPHITLARFKHTPWETIPEIDIDTIEVRQIALYESFRQADERKYHVIETIPLAVFS